MDLVQIFILTVVNYHLIIYTVYNTRTYIIFCWYMVGACWRTLNKITDTHTNTVTRVPTNIPTDSLSATAASGPITAASHWPRTIPTPTPTPTSVPTARHQQKIHPAFLQPTHPAILQQQLVEYNWFMCKGYVYAVLEIDLDQNCALFVMHIKWRNCGVYWTPLLWHHIMKHLTHLHSSL